MIRQAHTYLAGAVSGTALVAAAVVAFVALVSVQAVKDWPLPGLVAGHDSGSVSAARPAGGNGGGPTPHAGAPRSEGAATATPAGGASGREGGGGPVAGTAPRSEATATAPATRAGQPTAKKDSGAGAGSTGANADPGSGSAPVVPETVGNAAGEAASEAGAAAGGAAGTVGGSGVGHTVEEAVNGVAGSRSPVGEAVTKTVKAAEGLLPGNE